MSDLVDRKFLLSSVEMARFVSDGYLRLEGIVADELNAAAVDELTDPAWFRQFPYGTPLADTLDQSSAIAGVLRSPAVAGAIQSLVGPNPTGDHHWVHIRDAREGAAQHLHGDAVFDVRPFAFDVQMMYYPERVGADDGGTLVVPGTHLRRINQTDVARYQNVAGQLRLTCEPGTVMFLHHGIWHAGRRNDSDRRRIMYKIRLNPTVRQLRLWNTDDIDSAEVEQILSSQPRWSGGEGRLEQINRAKLWRYLSGDDQFDIDYYLTRTTLSSEVVSPLATDRRPAVTARGPGFDLPTEYR